MRVWCATLAVAVLAVAVAADPDTGRHLTAAQRIYRILQRVNENDRSEFIRYHLHKGYELAQKEQSSRYPGFNYEISNKDSLLIYEYFSTYNDVTDDEVAKVARTVICWKDKCIDFADPGIHP